MSTVSIQLASTHNAVPHSLDDYIRVLHDKVSQRAFSIFEHNGRHHGHDVEDWLKAESEFLIPVPLDVLKTYEGMAVRAGVPGFAEQDLEIIVEPGRLFITGKNERRTVDLSLESSANEVFRTITLPADINPAKVTAQLENGVLSISLPTISVAKKEVASAQAA